MGLDYSYEVYIHRDRAPALLGSIADNMAEESRHGEWTIAEIAGDRVLLPCSARFESGRTVGLDPSGSKHEFLDLVLRFDADDSLRAYNDPEDDGRHRVGLIYLSVHDASRLAPDHLEFCFMAATTRMSRLFLESSGVRNWFASLAIDHDSPLCLLDIEQDGKQVVFERSPQ
ncbi:hypothetical protein [Nocardia heshunensis]